MGASAAAVIGLTVLIMKGKEDAGLSPRLES